jgi:hypothetical protein
VRGVIGLLLLLAGVAVLRPSGIAALAALLSALAAMRVVAGVRGGGPLALATVTAASLAASMAPLWRTFVDQPPEAPPRFAGGRVYERAAAEAHPIRHAPDWPPPEPMTREIFRRASRELWALTGALAGMPYAFDGDPDGIYFEGDRVVGKSIESLPWAERAPALRASGVAYVVAAGELPPPFARLAVLSSDRDIAVHRLEGAAPSVRVATRLLPAVEFQDVVALLSRPDFDPLTNAVVMTGRGPITGVAQPAPFTVAEETTTRLRVRVEAPAPALLVWSRTYFPAWRARVDGAAAETVVGDGHLVAVRVPAGAHEVEIAWSRGPLLAGAAIALLGLGSAVVLGRVRDEEEKVRVGDVA